MLGVIGGSGFYNIDEAEIIRQENILTTPFGAPSSPITILRVGEKESAFIARHGNKHTLLPSEINYRANIWALKTIGVRQIISVSAVGSLQNDLAPGDFVVPAQYIDFTKGIRPPTFFGNGIVAHISTAKPTCPHLSAALVSQAVQKKLTIHENKTYICVEGPRLGTQAESLMFKSQFQADVVGMTNIPEVFLAREAQINYATLAVVTDYDCWKTDASLHVTVQEVLQRFGQSITRAKEIVTGILANPPAIDEEKRRTLNSALLTPTNLQTPAHQSLLKVLLD